MDEMITDPVDVPEPVLKLGYEDMADDQAQSDQPGTGDLAEAGGAAQVTADEHDALDTDEVSERGEVSEANHVAGEASEAEDVEGEVAYADTDGGAVPAAGTTAIHWLARIAERAGLDGERPDLPPDTPAVDAWSVVSRSYKMLPIRPFAPSFSRSVSPPTGHRSITPL